MSVLSIIVLGIKALCYIEKKHKVIKSHKEKYLVFPRYSFCLMRLRDVKLSRLTFRFFIHHESKGMARAEYSLQC